MLSRSDHCTIYSTASFINAVQCSTATLQNILVEVISHVATASLLIASRGELVHRNLRNAPWESFALEPALTYLRWTTKRTALVVKQACENHN